MYVINIKHLNKIKEKMKGLIGYQTTQIDTPSIYKRNS